MDGTYQSLQGKTIETPEGEPKGFVIDLYRLPTMVTKTNDEYKLHLHMILGRARKLKWCLLRNFPHTPDGEPDWSLFETGPPACLIEFMRVLEDRAAETQHRMLQCQRELGFPAWEDIPQCELDQNDPTGKRYLYNPADWGFQPRDGTTPTRTIRKEQHALFIRIRAGLQVGKKKTMELNANTKNAYAKHMYTSCIYWLPVALGLRTQ